MTTESIESPSGPANPTGPAETTVSHDGAVVAPNHDTPSVAHLAPEGSPDGTGFTHRELVAIDEEMFRLGQISKEQFDATLRGAGIDPATRNAPTTEVDEFYPAAQSPAQYDYGPLLADGEYSAVEAAEFGKVMVAARVPAGVGNSLVEHAVKARNTVEDMTPEGRQLWAREQFHQQIRIIGKGDESVLQEKLELARDFLHEVERIKPGVRAELAEIGALDSCQFVAQLVMHAERLQARKAELEAGKKK